jgi:hypothetical protein
MQPSGVTSEYPLSEFVDRHRGETAWVFGKGPSLDLFDMSKAGPLRCCINDVITRVPKCLYAFANDRINDWIELYNESHILFTPIRTIGDSFLRSMLPDKTKTVIYEDKAGNHLLYNGKETLAHCLAIRRGTLGSVVQILYIMGVKKIVAVGIDGGNTHASGHWKTRLRAEHYVDYNAIRDQFIDTCDTLGIELEMFNTDYRSERNGKMKVQFLKNIFVREQAYKYGDVATLLPADAKDLVQQKAAFYFKASEPAEKRESTPEPVKVAAKKAARKKADK